MKRNKRVWAVLMVVMFGLSFVLPGLISPGVAEAASTYTAVMVPTLQANMPGQNLGAIQVDVPNCAAILPGDVLTVSLPSEIAMAAAGPVTITYGPVQVGPNATGVEIFVPGGGIGGPGLPPINSAIVGPTRTSLDITFAGAGTSDPGRLFIYISGVTVGSIDGDIVAHLLGPANSAFSSGSVIVGKVASSSYGTVTSIKSVKNITAAGGNIDAISIYETAPGTVTPGDIIKVKLPRGFSWGAVGGSQAWGWAGSEPAMAPDPGDNRILNISITGPIPSIGTGGRVDVTSVINVDEAVANTGDVVAHIYDTSGRITSTDLVIARYGEVDDVYQVLSVPAIHANSISNLGIIEVNVPSAAGIVSGDVLTISLPEEIGLPGASAGNASHALLTTEVNAAAGGGVEVFVPLNPVAEATNGFTTALAEGSVIIEPNRNVININFSAAGGSEAGKLLVYLRGAAVGAINKDVTASITSTSAVLPSGSLVVARFSNVVPTINTTYSALTSPLVQKNAMGQNLGVIQVDVANSTAIMPGDVLTLSLPGEVAMAEPGPVTITYGPVQAGPNATGVEVFVPGGGIGGPGLPPINSAVVGSTRNSLDITFAGMGTPDPGRLFIYITGVTVGSIDGDIVAQLLGPANSAFNPGSVVVGRVASSISGTAASIKSVNTIGPNGGPIDVISIAETAPGTVRPGDVIQIKLPNGFHWAGPAGGAQDWGWAGNPPMVAPNPVDSRILDIIINGALPSISTGGRVDIIGHVYADSGVAPFGDVVAHIYDTYGNITATDLLIARYATYGVSILEGDQPELMAGKAEQKLGDFLIAEELAGSLIGGRNITLTLPEGAKWWSGYFANGLPAGPFAESGNLTLGPYALKSDGRTLQTNITANSTTRSKIRFKDLKADIAPDFAGPMVITVGGTGGASGEVVVGNVNPVITFNNCSCTHIVKGSQNQVLGDLIISETRSGGIAQFTNTVWSFAMPNPPVKGCLNLILPAGAYWSEDIPSIEVMSGDLQFDLAAMTIMNNVISIPVKYSSTAASTIKISGLKATLSTTVPDGAFLIAIDGTAVNETGGLNLPFAQYTAARVMLAGIGSSNADLSELMVNGTGVKNFAPANDTYYVNLPLGTLAVPEVIAVATDSSAIVEVVQAVSLEGDEADRTATVTVVAADGIASRTYKVVFSLAAAGNADLNEIKVDGVNIAGFSPDVTSYNVKLAVGTAIVPAVTAVAQDAGANVTITPAANLSGTAAERTAIITVTPANGPAKTYQVTFWVAKDYLEKKLPAGWNILSAPLELERSMLSEIVADPAKILLAYRYDSSTSSWNEVAGNAVLNPMDAICLKLSGETAAQLYPSTSISGPYSRVLNVGWNLFGPALDISSARDNKMNVGRVLTSINSTKYSQVVSQRMGSQYPWTYVPGDSSYPEVQAGEGYWIYMKEQGTLAGFSYTPVEDVFYDIPVSSSIFMASSYATDGVPSLPAAFMGTVKDKAGNSIAEGKIEVVIDGVVRASKAFTDGQFGLSLGERLVVEKMYYANAGEITFNVNGCTAVADPPIEWAKVSGNLTELHLVVDTDVPEVFCYKTVALTDPNVVELSFSKELKNNLADNTALKGAISYSSADGIFSALNEADTISIEGNKLIIRFASAVSGNDNQIRVEANTLSDLEGNVIAEPIVTSKFTAQVVDECFIATASFGSKFEPAVVLLRAFRDQYLLTNTMGTAFVEFYYRHSPPVAAFIAGSEPLKAIVRILLLPFIAIVYSIYHPLLLSTIILGVFALLLLRRRTHQA